MFCADLFVLFVCVSVDCCLWVCRCAGIVVLLRFSVGFNCELLVTSTCFWVVLL